MKFVMILRNKIEILRLICSSYTGFLNYRSNKEDISKIKPIFIHVPDFNKSCVCVFYVEHVADDFKNPV